MDAWQPRRLLASAAGWRLAAARQVGVGHAHPLRDRVGGHRREPAALHAGHRRAHLQGGRGGLCACDLPAAVAPRGARVVAHPPSRPGPARDHERGHCPGGGEPATARRRGAFAVLDAAGAAASMCSPSATWRSATPTAATATGTLAGRTAEALVVSCGEADLAARMGDVGLVPLASARRVRAGCRSGSAGGGWMAAQDGERDGRGRDDYGEADGHPSVSPIVSRSLPSPICRARRSAVSSYPWWPLVPPGSLHAPLPCGSRRTGPLGGHARTGISPELADPGRGGAMAVVVLAEGVHPLLAANFGANRFPRQSVTSS